MPAFISGPIDPQKLAAKSLINFVKSLHITIKINETANLLKNLIKYSKVKRSVIAKSSKDITKNKVAIAIAMEDITFIMSFDKKFKISVSISE